MEVLLGSRAASLAPLTHSSIANLSPPAGPPTSPSPGPAAARRKMKARAPPPPGRPTTPNVHRGQRPSRDASPSPPQNLLSRKETLDGRVVAMTVVLPSGLEKKSVVNGSHAMMDLLVELCLQNHLNPSNHALEILSSETQQPLNFKPNTLVGTLNAHTVFLKEKVPEAKVKAGPAKVPEKTVRLVVNYLRTQKAVVRVSPEVPLQSILPVICAKCDVSPEHVVLLRDNVAGEELELSKSLNELGIKELYAWDNKRGLLDDPKLPVRESPFHYTGSIALPWQHLRGVGQVRPEEAPSASPSVPALRGTTRARQDVRKGVSGVTDGLTEEEEACTSSPCTPAPAIQPAGAPPHGGQGGGQEGQDGSGRVAPALHEDEDLFMTGQFQKTLAELDEELEEIEESYETDSSFLTNCIHSMSGRCPQGTNIPDGDTEAIPVTFIGEVLDDPVDSVAFTNRNNNAGSFDAGSTASKKAQLPPCQAEHSQQHGQRRAAGPGLPAPSQDPGREVIVASTNTWKDVTPSKMAPKATSASALHTHDLNAKEERKVVGSAHGGRTLATRRVSAQPGKEKEGDDKSDVWTLPPWYRDQHPGGSYGLKYGLTTYKIVPPKSEMKCYDRGASLSTGAIKIDELGNLVSPHTNAGRTIVPTSPTLEAEAPPIGKVKEFWRSNSIEKHSGRPTEGAKRTSTPTTPTNLQPQESRLRAEPASPDPKATLPRPQSPNPEDGRPLEEGRSWPLRAAACALEAPAANAADAPFLRPQRRTSSQYVASAIAKRIGTPKVHTDVGRKPDNAQKTCEEPDPPERPPTVEDGTTPSLYPETGVRHSGDASAAGAHPGGQISSPYGKLSTQDGPTGIHRTSHGPLITAAQRGQASVGQSCGLSGKQSPRKHRTSSASDPKCQPAGTSPPPARSGGDETPGSALVNGSRWVSVHKEPLHSPRVSDTSSHAEQEPPEWEEKPSVSSTDVPEADGTLPASIFGPKKKFRPVVQRPAPKDTSLHSALMEAIHSAGGKDRLRKTPEPGSEGGPKKPSYTETDSERSALLAAIRGHSGTCSLRKVTSSASEELQSLRDAVLSAHGAEPPGPEDFGIQSPPALPPPSPPSPPVTQAPTASQTASRSSSGPLSNPVDARQALMDAIRSGTGAARLRKVPLLV
ncbi:protein cordon-bleu isoform X8 [Delphinapterus leucas]|uniref:Protein cordon-bleu isoform X8 n=1 Tax=Delphinapterus leucas TaxID=9749 RepID=A0A7F8K9T5_DELLE|nr:protein cordon-bleu isoform X8 [Delphinapterus leucas]